jgi:hypothetical protein
VSPRSKKFSIFSAGLVVILAVAGGFVYFATRAITPPVAVEAESGTTAGSASATLFTNASGGKAVWFAGPNPPPNPNAAPIPPVGTYDTLNKKAGFVFTCTMAKQAPDDPIVFPNQPGVSHLHTFAGNTSIDAFSRAATLVRAPATSCGLSGNKSAYWIPTIVDANGSPIRADKHHIYYQAFGGTENLTEMPFGLRMLAGDPRATADQTYYRFGWRCRLYSGPIIDSTGVPHGCDAGQRLQAFVVFPACWDGKNLDSSDHRSHLSYTCTASHPVRIPEVTFEADYNTPPPKGTEIHFQMEGHNLTRYGLHADAFEAWDPAFSRAVHNVCLANNRDCSPNFAVISDASLPSPLTTSMIGGLPIPTVD